MRGAAFGEPQTIGELERYYGVSLFDRVGRRLVLTPEGERLRVKAQEAIASFSEFEEAARDTKARHIIRIGSSVTAGQMVLPRLIAAIEITLDRAECRAIADSAAAVEQLVEEGSLDFALVEGSARRGERFARPRGGGGFLRPPYGRLQRGDENKKYALSRRARFAPVAAPKKGERFARSFR